MTAEQQAPGQLNPAVFGDATVSDTIDTAGLRLLQERDSLEELARRALGIRDGHRVYVTIGRTRRQTTVHLTWWLHTRKIDVWHTVQNTTLDKSRDMRAMALTASVATLCQLAKVSQQSGKA